MPSLIPSLSTAQIAALSTQSIVNLSTADWALFSTAQAAALTTGEQRLTALIDRYGAGVVKQAIAEMRHRAERQMRLKKPVPGQGLAPLGLPAPAATAGPTRT